jgi:hypothetical protein
MNLLLVGRDRHLIVMNQVYPIAELLTNGAWNATEKQVCFRLGPRRQRLDVWMTPDTGDGAFVAYMQGTTRRGSTASQMAL